MHRHFSPLAGKLTLLAASLVASAALAQGVTGAAVNGTVTDPDGAPIEGAAVQLRNQSTGNAFTAVTGNSGRYFVDNVPPGGPYQLTVVSEGYQPNTREGLQLALGQRLAVNVSMRYMGEAVEIVSHLDALDDKARTGASTMVKEKTIQSLPLQGRNFTDLVQTSPVVSGTSIAGQNNRFNNIQIDGGANNDLFGLAASGTPGGQSNAKPLSIEAIREFQVQVAPFDVRLSSFTGGLVNAITKSGTNEYHGSLFGYFQNKSLAGYQDDPTFLNYDTEQFGATLSGPIVKDKLHFFIATDIQRRQSAFGNAFQIGGVDPVADTARAGFSNDTAQKVIDILKNKYGIDAGNALAPNLGNPDRNLFVKVSTSAIQNSNLEISYNLVNANQDTLIRSPTATSVPFSLRDGYELSKSGYGIADTTNTGRLKLTTNWDGGRLSNEFLGSASFIRDARKPGTNSPLILVNVGSIGASPSWIAAGAERFSQSNVLDQDIYQLQDNVTFATGAHRLTVGTSNEFLKLRNVFLQASTGVWAFNSIADLDNGTVAAFERRFGASPLQDPGTAAFNVAQYGVYVQDEWSLFRNFSLTPGVRADLPILSHANQNPVLMTAALPIDTSKVPTGNLLWSPRLGFNWDVDGTNDTVVRGGAGIFTGRPPYVWVSNAYTINGLSQVQLTCTPGGPGGVPVFTPDPNNQPSSCTGGTGTPTPPTNQGEIDYFDPNTKYPQNMRMALGVDRRLPWGIVGTADLLYTRDVNGWYVNDENLQVTGTSGEGRTLYGSFAKSTPTKFSASPTRIDSTYLTQAVKVTNKSGGQVYSGTVQLQKQFATYGVSVGYTYSKSRDRMSLTSSQALSNFRFAPLDGDLDSRALRPSAFDRPHKITVTGTADLPYGFGLGVSYIGQSGLPYTWTVSGDVNGDGINGNDLAFVPADPSQITLKDPTQYAALSSFIDSQSCLREARGSFVRRGACRNPWQSSMDMRISWTSPKLKGEQRIEVQWDIFNVLNLVNRNWGHLDQVTPFENAQSAFLSAVGYDKVNNRPIYNFVQPSSVVTTVFSPTQSRWRMQLGAKYVF